MYCFVSKKNLKKPYLRGFLDPAMCETVENSIWTNQVRVDRWETVNKRNPGNPWKHMSSLYGPPGRGPCLITGCGPSIKALQRKPSCPSFAINRSVLHYPADYWCFTEKDALDSVMESGRLERVPDIICNIQLYDYLKNIPATLVEYEEDPLRWPPERRPLIWNQTTLGWLVHLCVRMGFSPIYFIGTELTTDGHYDGSIQPGVDRIWQMAQLQGVCERMIEMFSDEIKPRWLERDVEFRDASGGNLPVPKCRVEDIP